MTINDLPPDGYVFRSIPRSHIEAISQSPAGKSVDITRAVIRNHIRKMFEQSDLRTLLNHIVPATINYTTKSVPNKRSQKRVYIETLFTGLYAKFPLIMVADSGSVNKPYLDAVHHAYAVEKKYVYDYLTEKQISIEISYADLDPTGAEEIRSALEHIFLGISDVTRTKVLFGKDGDNPWTVRFPKTIDSSVPSRINVGEDNIDSYYLGTVSMQVEFEAHTLVYMDASSYVSGRTESMYAPLNIYNPGDLPEEFKVSRPVVLLDVNHMQHGVTVMTDNSEVAKAYMLDPTQIQLTVCKVGTAKLMFVKQPGGTVLHEHEFNVVV